MDNGLNELENSIQKNNDECVVIYNQKFVSFKALENCQRELALCKKERDEYKMGGVVINEVNWNPYVYNKTGEKEYYQRDFVWSIKDKQTLIDSIYNGVDCGKILVRLRSWDDLEKMAKNGEKELAFREIVDGKQRLDAIRGFIEGEYPDSNGKYYNDLSDYAQRRLVEHQLFSYAEMPKSTTDEEVIYQFLKMNFCGVPQSKQHIDFVKSLQNKL